MKVIVIGGGPAGMAAAIHAKEQGNDVIIIEKMRTLGRKLLITGKGRCNVTSSKPIEEFIENTPGNGKFLYSAFKEYTNEDIKEFLKSQGLELKKERGDRYFPVTDKSIDVLECFILKIRKLGIQVKYNTKVEGIILEEDVAVGVKTKDENILGDKIILATGGKSYPLTGSTGDGYYIARNVGHNITKIRPSLVPLEMYNENLCKNLQGLSLKNVSINILDTVNGKKIYEDFGEMLFTHYGVSGPIILSASSHLVRYKGGKKKDVDIIEKMKNKEIKLCIDFKPALTEEKLEKRVMRDFEECKNKVFKNSLDNLLPSKLIPIIIEKSGIDANKKVNEIKKEERQKLVKLLKSFELLISDFRPIEEAVITSGGVDIKEINPKTMESKKIKNLFFAGEIIDVDSYTGGFNLQIAYSTGFVAGSDVD